MTTSKWHEYVFPDDMWMVWLLIIAATTGFISWGVYGSSSNPSVRNFTIGIGIVFCLVFSCFAVSERHKAVRRQSGWN